MPLLDVLVDGTACSAAICAACYAWRARGLIAILQEELAVARTRFAADRTSGISRGDVLGSIAHEIGTPVNAIVGMADAICAGPLDPSQREAAAIAQRHSRALFGVIGELLDYTKLDARQLVLETSCFAPRTMLSDIAALLSPVAAARGRAINALCDDDLPAALSGDAARLGRTLVRLATHLLENGETGNVTVAASLEEREGVNVRVRFSVTDDRNAYDLATLEQSFAERGARFGLEICRRVIEHMGGTLQAARAAGRGSVLRFAVPLVAVEAPPSPLCGMLRVLIVDDDPVNRRVLIEQLHRYGLQVDTADDGVGAIDALMLRDYDLVFMDLNMPRMDGLTAARTIREREQITKRRTAVVALTASRTKEAHAACLAAGLDDVVTKPLGRRRLEEIPARWVQRPAAAV